MLIIRAIRTEDPTHIMDFINYYCRLMSNLYNPVLTPPPMDDDMGSPIQPLSNYYFDLNVHDEELFVLAWRDVNDITLIKGSSEHNRMLISFYKRYIELKSTASVSEVADDI